VERLVQRQGLRVAGRPGEPPLLEVTAIDLRVVCSYLFTGQIRAHEIAITSPVVHLARIGPNELSISDIIQRFADDGKKPADEKETFEILADLILVANGLVLFEDRAVAPPRTFEVKDLTINSATSRPARRRPTGTIAFVLNGTPVAVVAATSRCGLAHLRPSSMSSTSTSTGVGLRALRERAGPPRRGRFSTSIDLAYDAAAGSRSTSTPRWPT
jgi:hypothetical protein